MRTAVALARTYGAAALVTALAACSAEPPTSAAATSSSGPSAAVVRPVAVRLASTPATTASATPSAAVLAADFGDGGRGHHRGWWVGRIRPDEVDSLIVTVTKIEVPQVLTDSEAAADSVEDAADSMEAGDSMEVGDSAADSVRADSAMRRDRDREHDQDEIGWTALDLVGSGHLDLMHLPDSASGGLMVARGTLPAGTYRHVRIFVTLPVVYFNTPIATPAGDTLAADTGYPVTIPSADSTGAAMKTDEPFVVPADSSSATVPLYFDRDDTVRHIVLTGSGRIIVPPVIR